MDVKLPNLGEGADSGVVVSISVKEGDRVEEGQTLIELENEKAVAPIPASAAAGSSRRRAARPECSATPEVSTDRPIVRCEVCAVAEADEAAREPLSGRMEARVSDFIAYCFCGGRADAPRPSPRSSS